MHEMNVLVTVAVIAGLYIALFYVADKVFMRDSESGFRPCSGKHLAPGTVSFFGLYHFIPSKPDNLFKIRIKSFFSIRQGSFPTA